jgi:hypothetical protein
MPPRLVIPDEKSLDLPNDPYSFQNEYGGMKEMMKQAWRN